MTLLDRVSALLDEAGIPHALIGAAALAAAGVARSTFDVDLLVLESSVLSESAWAPLRHEGAVVEIRRGDDDDPLKGVVRIEATAERPVDVIVGRPAWQARVLERALKADTGPPVATPCDLILLKLYAGGSQDLWDVRELLRGETAERLIGEVEAELVNLPPSLGDRWRSARS
jgi:hypothetical protein